MSLSKRFLVCGDVCGNIDQLYKRVCVINKKAGPFELLLCVGEFFDYSRTAEWDLYKKGKKQVPITTYLLGPVDEKNKDYYPDINGGELAENVIYLGRSGIYPCNNGLKIAYLSGNDAKKGSEKSEISFNLDDIKSLEVAAGNRPKIDILFTSQWPNSIFNYAKVPEQMKNQDPGSILISRLAFKLKPRYHFVGLKDLYYERLPYRNHHVLRESAHHVTRFISLAKVGNLLNQKWLYAVNAIPIAHLDPVELNKQPPDVTECPYSELTIEQSEKYSSNKGSSVPSNQYFYDTSSTLGDNDSKSMKRKKNCEEGNKKRKQLLPAGSCWFCLASPDVEKHLVVSVGTYSYLALAKGGLVSDHVLIMPIEHFQSTSDIEQGCREEIDRFKAALKKMFTAVGKVVVFFERNYRTQHMQIQAVPLPSSLLPQIKESFIDGSEDNAFSLDEVPKHSDISQLAPPGTPFFYTDLPDGSKLFFRIRKGFPLQFGREVLASPPLLNIPEKVDWKECKISQSVEIARKDEIRKMFKPFDFTLEDDSDSSSKGSGSEDSDDC